MVIFGVFWGKLMRRVFIWAAIDGRDQDTKGKWTRTAATGTRNEMKRDAANLAATQTRNTRVNERGGRDGPPLIMGSESELLGSRGFRGIGF